jgi:hypothetical protein
VILWKIVIDDNAWEICRQPPTAGLFTLVFGDDGLGVVG